MPLGAVHPMEERGATGWLSRASWNHPQLEPQTQYLLICSVYLLIFAYHTRRSLPVYHVNSCQKRSMALALHILAGAFELTRYYARAVKGPVLPDLADTAACFAHSFTTLTLARTLLRGDKTTRASYQAPALMRPLLALIAIGYENAFIHEASVKLLHAFLYTRLIIFLAKRIGMNKVQSYATVYAHAVSLGAIVAIHYSGLPGGVPVYIGAVGVVMVFNHRMSAALSKSAESGRYTQDTTSQSISRHIGPEGIKSAFGEALMRMSLWIGLVNIETIKAQDRSSIASAWTGDEYVESKN
ncbi:hypothetical protein CEP54_013063 [Fusarium duplospermum]|uniref:Uncharacterized protein n=1 Tax=Fusarium duplospermum TaxID=1325734 RepID=A0A428P548_9HYPO|nr:hypothetical protein CEP54_013063 [Fusarium duplospermum]